MAVRLINLRAAILEEYPFFGRLLLRLPFGFADCETAYTDMNRIVFDPDFISKLDDDGLTFLILHELMHCVLKHCTRGKHRPNLRYNIACDIVVNSVLLEALGRESIVIADKEAMHLAPDGTEGRLHSAEEVDDMLAKNNFDELYEAHGSSSFDSHAVWRELSADSPLEDIWDNHIKDAGKRASKHSGIPDALKRIVEAAGRKSKISWQQVLHDYIKHNSGDYLFSAPDKRYSGDIIMPSFKEEVSGSRLQNVWYAVDTSGSIGAREIGEAFSEIKAAVEQIENVEGYISFFDSEITEPIAFESIEDIESIIPIGGGGTSFKAIFRYLADNLSENLPRVIIIITDGYAEFPSIEAALGVPIIWLIVNSCIEPPFGETLHVYADD